MSHVPIRVNTLRGDQKIDFKVYLTVAGKMILYLNEGDNFEGPRLERLKSKKLKKMFIRPEDEPLYRQYVQRNIEMAYDENSGKDVKTRSEIVHGEQQSNAEAVFENPTQEIAYQSAKDGMERYVGFLLKNDKSVASILNIENTDRSLSHHGVNVATLSTALARKLKTFDPKVIETMALGGLLHDFGHQQSGQEQLRSDKDMGAEEKEIYHRHPLFMLEKIQEQKHFDPLVIKIVAMHEECIDGSGYPKKLQEKDLDPAVIVVASANAFDRFVSAERVPPKEAGKRMMVERVGKHPLQHLKMLMEIAKDTEAP